MRSPTWTHSQPAALTEPNHSGKCIVPESDRLAKGLHRDVEVPLDLVARVETVRSRAARGAADEVEHESLGRDPARKREDLARVPLVPAAVLLIRDAVGGCAQHEVHVVGHRGRIVSCRRRADRVARRVWRDVARRRGVLDDEMQGRREPPRRLRGPGTIRPLRGDRGHRSSAYQRGRWHRPYLAKPS